MFCLTHLFFLGSLAGPHLPGSSAICAPPRSTDTKPAGAASITATSTSVRRATGRKRRADGARRKKWLWSQFSGTWECTEKYAVCREIT